MKIKKSVRLVGNKNGVILTLYGLSGQQIWINFSAQKNIWWKIIWIYLRNFTRRVINQTN